MSLFCFLAAPCWGHSSSSLDDWITQVHCSLRCSTLFGKNLQCSNSLRNILLDDTDADFDGKGWDEKEEKGEEEEDNSQWLAVVQGVPRRPLYKELAFRLFRWNKKYYHQSFETSNKIHAYTSNRQDYYFMIPAASLGLEETIDHDMTLPLPPQYPREVQAWMRQHGSDPILLRVLGMRQTVGSDPTTDTNSGTKIRNRIIPSRANLLQAAEQLHHPNSKLTVAARARSKHAHRGTEDQFFGVCKGKPQLQNEQTQMILKQLLEQAVWINVHTFGGLDEGVVVAEIRVLQGYGARWMLQTLPNNTNKDGDESIQFRGFLEPQMKDGHENKWRH